MLACLSLHRAIICVDLLAYSLARCAMMQEIEAARAAALAKLPTSRYETRMPTMLISRSSRLVQRHLSLALRLIFDRLTVHQFLLQC